MINTEEIIKALTWMKPNKEIFEIRILSEKSKSTLSGYFDDAYIMIDKLRRLSLDDMNVYITINGLNEACFDRKQKNCFIQNATTTSDNDVDIIEWLMIDLDPKRPSKTSSTNDQLNKAKQLGNKIYLFMAQLGFYKPLTAMSGNGVHLMYKVSLKNSKENIELLKKCLLTLDMLFSNNEIDIDKKTFNASRICKLYGTVAQKGTSTEKRPHRMSYVTQPGDEAVNDKAYLVKLASYYPQEPEKPQQYNNYNPREFDLEEWMDKYHLNYRKTAYADGDKYILDCCPFDNSHTGKDACIFRGRNGAIGFHCFHNSCDGKTWKDVRVLYEPDAYERREQAQNKIRYGSFNRENDSYKNFDKEVMKNPNITAPTYLKAIDIFNIPRVEEQYIKTGINVIDEKMLGLKKGYVSVWSGLRSSAKSTVLSQIMLQAVQDKNNVACYSGELTPRNFMKWMNLQAAGKAFTKSTASGFFYVEDNISKKIANWMGDHFYLYNNDYGNDYVAIRDNLVEQILDKKIDFVVMDNLMSLNITGLSDDKWNAQSQFVFSLQEVAKKLNVHIAFVAHPRKTVGFLRLNDISGSGDIANAVDNAFIVHRNNNDFKRLSREMFKWNESDPIYSSTNVIEICKDRDNGEQDVFIPLFYELESKRLKNKLDESIPFGWQDEEDRKQEMESGFTEILNNQDSPFDGGFE